MQALESAPPAQNDQPGKNKESKNVIQQIVLNCLGLYTQNTGLREVDLEPSPKKGSDKIDMQKQGRNTPQKANRIIQPGLTYRSQHLERW